LGGGDDLLQIGFDSGTVTPSFSEVHIDTATLPPVIKGVAFAPGAGFTMTPRSVFDVPDNDQVLVWAINTRGE